MSLSRRTPLRRGAPLARGNGLARTGAPLRRTRLSPISARRRADLPRRAQVRDDVHARDGGCLLEHYGIGPCGGRLELHELRKASQGDDTYTFDNGVSLCTVHNQWVEDNPTLAHLLGLVIRAGDNPADATARRQAHGLVPKGAR